MELNFGKFRIKRLDLNNIVVEELKEISILEDRVKTGEKKKEWVALGYFGNLEKALKSLVDFKLNSFDHKSVSEVLMTLDGIKFEIESFFRGKRCN
jgi:hypothetical protein